MFGMAPFLFSPVASVASGDPYSANVTLMIHGTAFTNAVNGSNATLFGNSTLTTSRTKFGSAMLFDGNGDYATFPATTNISHDFTLEMWFNIATDGFGGWNNVFTNCASFNGTGISVFINSAGVMLQTYQNAGFLSNNTWLKTISFNTEHHLTITKSGLVITIYIDGTSIGNVTLGANFPASDTTCAIGANTQNVGSYPFFANGSVEEVRWTDSIVRYTGNFTPPTTRYVYP